MFLIFWPDLAPKLTWLGTDAPPGAAFTAKHHSLVTYQGHGMVQQQQMRCNGCKLLEFGLRWVGHFQTFEIWPKNWLDLAQMLHQELVSQQNITHWSHTKGMEWISSNRWGVMAANCLSLGPDWLDLVKLLIRSGPKTDLAWHRCSTRSWFHIKTSLIGHIPRVWNGSAATPQMRYNGFKQLEFGLRWVWSSKLLTRSGPKNWLGLAQMLHKELVSQKISLIGHIPSV
jgi:hypothetical protein